MRRRIVAVHREQVARTRGVLELREPVVVAASIVVINWCIARAGPIRVALGYHGVEPHVGAICLSGDEEPQPPELPLSVSDCALVL